MESEGSWNPRALGNGHEIGFGYGSNGPNEVRRFDVTLSFANNTYTPTLSPNGHYGANELYKNVTRDENHPGTSTRNHTVEEFTDKQGRVVLKRTYADIDFDDSGTMSPEEREIPHDTNYVYDDYGNLTYVIPPKVETADGISSTELDELTSTGTTIGTGWWRKRYRAGAVRPIGRR